MALARAVLGFLLLGIACGPQHLIPIADAGRTFDAGPGEAQPIADAGAEPFDAGTPPPVDAGIPNAAAPELACDDGPDAIYAPPAGPAPTEDSARGDRVRCGWEKTISLTDMTSKISTATSAVAIFRLSYRTKRGNGAWATSSARAFLPQSPKAYPLPIIVVAHPSVGIADSCAPTKAPEGTFDLALPWAAKGYAVIAPDFAGLGTEGIQAYVDSRDTGQSLLDAARALRKLTTPATFDQRIAMVGYSQGGGAVFAAQGLEKTYGSGGKLTAVAAMAPQWQSRLDSFGTITLLRKPNTLTLLAGITKPVITAMRQYGYFATYLGSAHAGDGFAASDRTAMVNALDTLCLIPFGGFVQGTHGTVGGLTDDALRTSTLACLDTPTDPACKEPGKSYLQYLRDNLIPPDPQGAAVLYLQGMLDSVMPVTEEAACNVPRMQQAGIDFLFCGDTGGSHLTIVDRQGDFALRWAEAKLSGTQTPTCAATQLAPCPP